MTEHETQGPYQLSRNLSALDLLLLLGLPPLPDLVLQLLSVHGLLLPVRGVPDVVVDCLPDTLVTLKPGTKELHSYHHNLDSPNFWVPEDCRSNPA